MWTRIQVVMIGICLTIFGTGVQAAILDVPGQFPTVEAALAVAGQGDIVKLAPGTYLEHDLVVPAGVTIAGTGSIPEEVVLDGEGLGRIMLLESLSEQVTLRNISFTGGHASGPTSYDSSGGAVFISNSRALLENCLFSANTADSHGGAIRCSHSSPEIISCRFFGNAAPDGGGGALDLSYNSSPQITDCHFLGNWAGWGGGLSCRSGSSPRVENSTLEYNEALGSLGFGGGVFADHFSNPDLLRSVVFKNQANYGGALASFPDGPINLDYCTVVKNEGHVLGGGFLVVDSSPLITGTILAFNGGLGLAVSGSELPQVTCTDIYGNTAGDWSGAIEDLASGFGNRSVDPQFCTLVQGQEHRFRLIASSPLVQPGSECGTLGALSVPCSHGSVAPVPVVPAAIEKFTVAPNPFNPKTTVRFEVARSQDIRVSVYGVDGRLVQVLEERTFATGPHEIVWSGRDHAGRQVESGVYFVKIDGRDVSQRLKITLLK